VSSPDRPSVFRTLFSADLLEEQAIVTLKKWIPTYIHEVERQRGLTVGDIPRPRYYARRNEFNGFPDDQLPMCIVISPGLIDQPERYGDGQHAAWWGCAVAIVCATSSEDSTNRLVKVYGAALRGVMLQQEDLGGTQVAAVRWEDERYDDNLPGSDQRRSLGAVRLVFRVLVDDVVTDGTGPNTPDPDEWPPGTQWGLVEDVIIMDEHGDTIVEVTP